MNKLIYTLLVASYLISSCVPENKESEVKSPETIQKEQALVKWELRLKQKEDSLLEVQKSLDSAQLRIDTSGVYKPAIIGMWEVNMICTQTSCEGSAIGDTKNEKWDIKYQDKRVVVKAMVNNQVVRTYYGVFKNNELQLQANNQPETTAISVTLKLRNDRLMEGIREIVQEKKCRTIYSTILKQL